MDWENYTPREPIPGELWTVGLAQSIVGVVVRSLRRTACRRTFPRSRLQIPWHVCEYLEAEDKDGRVYIRLTWDEVEKLKPYKGDNGSVFKRASVVYVSFHVEKHRGIGRKTGGRWGGK